MVESKKSLLDELRRVHVELGDLPDRIRKENMYLEDGFHVDTDFLLEILSIISEHVDLSAKVMNALEDLMGIDRSVVDKSKNVKEGKKWGVEEVLKHCTYSEGVLKLPNVQLNPKSYAEVKKWITEAGGKWNGGKVQGFTFDFDAERVVSVLMKGERCNLQKEFQFFETPAELADWLVSLAGVSDDDVVLEPSAGRGAIIKAVHRMAPDVVVDYFELMPENRQFLEKMDNVTFCGEDFTAGVARLYTRIFANPPFSQNQDIRHVRAMYDALDFGGVLCAITSQHWLNANEQECKNFRKWLDDLSAEVHEIPKGIFKESGTDVATTALKITKSVTYL